MVLIKKNNFRYAQKILEFSLQTLPLHAAEYILRSVGMKPQ